MVLGVLLFVLLVESMPNSSDRAMQLSRSVGRAFWRDGVATRAPTRNNEGRRARYAADRAAAERGVRPNVGEGENVRL